MNIQEFIDENIEGLNEVLRSWGVRDYDDEAREDVIMNDEGWYDLAISEGVDV